jgi:hypothetical protein
MGIGPRPSAPHPPHQEPHQGPAALTRCGLRPPNGSHGRPLASAQETVPQIATDVEGLAPDDPLGHGIALMQEGCPQCWAASQHAMVWV